MEFWKHEVNGICYTTLYHIVISRPRMSIGIKSYEDFIERDVVAQEAKTSQVAARNSNLNSELMQKVFFSKMKDKPFAKKRHCRVR